MTSSVQQISPFTESAWRIEDNFESTVMKNKLITLLGLHLGLAAVVAQPVITNQPQNQTALAEATATFSVGATGTLPLSYQWVFNTLANRLPGATNDKLILPNVQASNAGNYRVTITNAAGSVLSGSGRLTVVTPPVITPANPTASLFADVTLLATNVSAGAISYQWLLDGAPMPGAVTNRLVVTNIQKSNAGDYTIVATYAFGSATSQVATLKIVPFNSIYCFGFSWTDTGGNGCTWSAPQYYQNRACNGPMWPEFLSTNLGLTYVGANNYARCGAFTSDMLNQITSLFRAPRNPSVSLYCLWAGGSDFLVAYPPNGFGRGWVPVTNGVAWNQLLQTMIQNTSNMVHRLYTNGARAMLLQNINGTNASDVVALGLHDAGILEGHIRRFNADLVVMMEALHRIHSDLRLYLVDVYSKLDDVLGHPDQFGFTETKIDALGDTNLTEKSFTGPGADYVFWDALHPTSKLYKLMASWHLEALTNVVLERLEAKLVNSSATVAMNRLLIGRDYTLQTSSDLANWNDVQTFTASAGTNQWSGGFGESAPKFFRLSWTP